MRITLKKNKILEVNFLRTTLGYYYATKGSLAMFAILLISNIGASAPNENVLHPNIVRAMDDADANTQIEFIVQYRPELTTQHLQVAEEIGIEVISTFKI